MKNYKNLVLEGTGMTGLAYIGVLKILEEQNIIDNIENIIGTSSGAIMASLISIGYTSEQIYNLSKNLDWSNMVKKRNCFFQMFHFWNRYGLFKYDNIEKTLKNFFFRKLGKTDITFKEHYEITKKNLILVGVNINNKNAEYFSYSLTPDMSVIKAIKISSSFPFIFDPVKHNNMLYIDGGIMNNFAIEYFGHKNPETLGIKIINNEKTNNTIDSIFHFGLNILESMFLVQQQDDLEFINENVIYIHLQKNNYSVLNNIVLMNQNIDELYQQGIICTKEYLNNIDLTDLEHNHDS